jgi:8-oxo-dGTP diphosphatase
MPSEDLRIPTFGLENAAVVNKPRPAAYAVIIDNQGRIAAVKGKSHYFLPGGGSLAEETPEQTAMREVREELACELRIISQIGKAVQFFQADGQNYRMEAVFFEGELIGVISETAEYELCWLDVGQIGEGFYHKCQVWAVKQLRDSKRYEGHLQET